MAKLEYKGSEGLEQEIPVDLYRCSSCGQDYVFDHGAKPDLAQCANCGEPFEKETKK